METRLPGSAAVLLAIVIAAITGVAYTIERIRARRIYRNRSLFLDALAARGQLSREEMLVGARPSTELQQLAHSFSASERARLDGRQHVAVIADKHGLAIAQGSRMTTLWAWRWAEVVSVSNGEGHLGDVLMPALVLTISDRDRGSIGLPFMLDGQDTIPAISTEDAVRRAVEELSQMRGIRS